MNGPTRCGIYVGKVTHRRVAPFQHRLRYRTYSLLVDLDELDETAAEIPILSHNRWNLFSIYDRDHGPRDGTPLRSWIDEQLIAAGIHLEGGSVQLLTFPRILGYTFNPLAMWFCHHEDGSLRAVLYEIRNTFGQSHSHLVPIDTGQDGPYRHHFAKELHVSPFFDRSGSYAFTLRPPAERFSVSIGYSADDQPLLTATMAGSHRPLTARTLTGAFLSHPLLTMKVTFGIHWNAFKLWRKGAAYHPLPTEPPTRVSFAGTLERKL